MLKLADMQQKQSTIAKQMRQLHEEIGDNSWSDEQRSKWDGMQHEHGQLEQTIERELSLQGLDQKHVEDSQEQRHQEQLENLEGESPTEQRAFKKYLRSGFGSLSTSEQQIIKEKRAQTAGTGSEGGFTVPTEFRERVVESMKAYGGIASVAQVINTESGNPMEWAVTDGTSEMGEIVGETQSSGDEDMVFDQAVLGAIKIGSKVIKVSNELLNDSGVDIESLITNRIAMRLGRKEADLIVKGTGAGTPKQNKGLAASVTGNIAAAANTGISHTDLVNLKHGVDPAYRNGNSIRYAFNDSTLKSIKLLKDTQNRPLWLPQIAGVAPATIDGDEFIIDQAIASFGANNLCAYYGDFNALVLRRVNYMMLRRLTEKYAESDMMGFVAFHRFDTCLEDVAAIKALQQPA